MIFHLTCHMNMQTVKSQSFLWALTAVKSTCLCRNQALFMSIHAMTKFSIFPDDILADSKTGETTGGITRVCLKPIKYISLSMSILIILPEINLPFSRPRFFRDSGSESAGFVWLSDVGSSWMACMASASPLALGMGQKLIWHKKRMALSSLI